uniref:Uncharacterized protein n=1 Tax=Schistocephalus solidus TaxID=70667 RepID=A0A0X3PTM5_SCHSO
MNEVAKSVDVSTSVWKTVFSTCIFDQKKASLEIISLRPEEVASFQYFGTRRFSNVQSEDDVVSRIDRVHGVFLDRRMCLWIQHDISLVTKLRVYRVSVQSVLHSGFECWVMSV